MSWIANKANQMSLRTGIPICNHGMVPVYHPTGGGCRCGDSVFRSSYSAPTYQPQPRMSGLMRAGFITNMIFGGLDFGMNLIGQILGWCGIGGGGGAQPPVQEQPKKEGEVSDLDALKQVFKDAKLVRQTGDNEYEVVDGDKIYKGSYQKIMDDYAAKKASPDKNKVKTNKPAKENTTVGDLEGSPREDGAGVTGDKYKIESVTTPPQTYTVSAGNTWWGIATKKYDIPPGVSKNDVAIALSAANSGLEGEAAMAAAHKGITFNVGDQITLPNELTVNGQVIKLLDNASSSGQAANESIKSDGSRNDRYFATGNNFHGRVTTVTINGVTKWKVLDKNNQQVGPLYDTQQAAANAKASLENQEQS